ncbi:MAG: hypothetical protein SFX18_03260 [Pirellulales bacterium]|nr:hypothetical protein [Pirellulales bacterium]
MNPYEPSQLPASAFTNNTLEQPRLEGWAIYREIFLRWERLRLVFNAVLVALSLIVGSAFGLLNTFRFWLLCVEGGIVLNICYFAGPVVESYFTWLTGRELKDMGFILFILGTILCMLAAVFSIAMQSINFTFPAPTF